MMFYFQSGQLGHSTNTIILKSNEHKSSAWVFSVICTFQSSQFFDRLSMHFGVVDHIRDIIIMTDQFECAFVTGFRDKTRRICHIYAIHYYWKRRFWSKTRWDSYPGIGLHLSIFYEYQRFFQHRICFSIQPPDYSDPWPRLARPTSFFLNNVV
jgi:hypothetical protein